MPNVRSAAIARRSRPESLPDEAAARRSEAVSEARAFIFEQGKLWLEQSPGPRWRGIWLLPQAETTNARADHVEVYAITRFRVTMRSFRRISKDVDLEGYFPASCRRCLRRIGAQLQQCWLEFIVERDDFRNFRRSFPMRMATSAHMAEGLFPKRS